ncbi:MAG: hypothetical protein EXR69_05915 [Myxococcales bacterium]|nr:hypothetical protein [Myxococcales bacterium]
MKLNEPACTPATGALASVRAMAERVKLVCPKRVCGVVVGLLYASAAHSEPGEHFQIGATAITPAMMVGVEYSSNTLHSAEAEGAGAFDLTIGPKLNLVMTKDNLDLGFNGAYQLRKYFGAKANLDRYDDFTVSADVNALKRSIVGLRLAEDIGIVNAPVDDVSAHPYATQFTTATSGDLLVRPGYALEITAGAEFIMDHFGLSDAQDSNGSSAFNTRTSYGPTASVTWKFLPRTAVLLDFSHLTSSYANATATYGTAPAADPTNPDAATDGITTVTFQPHSTTRVEGGLRGRVTKRLVVGLTGGYAAAAYGEPGAIDKSASIGGNATGGKPTVVDALQHLLADASVRYELTETATVTVGVDKNFRDSFFTNYVSYFKGYASADARFGDHFGAVAGFDASTEAFRGSETRDDLLLAVRGDLNYYIREWVWVNAGGGWTQRASDQAHADVQYDEFSGHFKLRLAY